jgi:hypothetical protein
VRLSFARLRKPGTSGKKGPVAAMQWAWRATLRGSGPRGMPYLLKYGEPNAIASEANRVFCGRVNSVYVCMDGLTVKIGHIVTGDIVSIPEPWFPCAWTWRFSV